MQVYRDQFLAGTNLDSQMERVPLSVLQKFVEAYKDKLMPINKDHDLGNKSVGHVEKIRLEKEKDSEEWSLIGDVYCDGANLETVVGGFSISYLEITNSVESAELAVYLPYPHYNNETLIASIQSNGNVSVGKWVKKALSPEAIGIIGAAVVFFVKPIWDDLYKVKIAPKIYAFFSSKSSELKSKNIGLNLIQSVTIKNKNIQVIFTPIRGKEEFCYGVEFLNDAMKLVSNFLNEESNPCAVDKIYLYFDSQNTGFKICKIELENGEIIHYV